MTDQTASAPASPASVAGFGVSNSSSSSTWVMPTVSTAAGTDGLSPLLHRHAWDEHDHDQDAHTDQDHRDPPAPHPASTPISSLTPAIIPQPAMLARTPLMRQVTIEPDEARPTPDMKPGAADALPLDSADLQQQLMPLTPPILVVPEERLVSASPVRVSPATQALSSLQAVLRVASQVNDAAACVAFTWIMLWAATHGLRLSVISVIAGVLLLTIVSLRAVFAYSDKSNGLLDKLRSRLLDPKWMDASIDRVSALCKSTLHDLCVMVRGDNEKDLALLIAGLLAAMWLPRFLTIRVLLMPIAFAVVPRLVSHARNHGLLIGLVPYVASLPAAWRGPVKDFLTAHTQ